MSRSTFIIALLLSAAAFAQTATPAPVVAPTTTPDFSPPPLVPATPPPEPAADPSAPPMTPPPGALTPQPGTPTPPGYVPGQPGSGYTYSPYGQGRNAAPRKPPGPEVGLMVSEALFGMLSAAGTTILPYFLLGLGSGVQGDIMGILTVALFALTPVVVSQTQVGIANGSAYYKTDAWIPLLVGLASEGIVLTTYYFANGKTFVPPSPYASSGAAPRDQSAVIWLFIGSLGVVPLLQMVSINLFKAPKTGILAKLGGPPDKNGFSVGLPMPAPVLSRTQAGLSVGAQMQFFRGTW